LAVRSDALAEDCESARLVVTTRQVPPDCPSAVVDQLRVGKQGSLVLQRTTSGFDIDAVWAKGTERPWAPPVSADAELGSSLETRPRPKSAVDATPSEADLQEED